MSIASGGAVSIGGAVSVGGALSVGGVVSASSVSSGANNGLNLLPNRNVSGARNWGLFTNWTLEGELEFLPSSTWNNAPGTGGSGLRIGPSGYIVVSSCTGCSVIAEMMPIEGPVSEGQAVCINSESGKISVCTEDASLDSFGIATNHAEQILRLGCSKSTTTQNSLVSGGHNDFWSTIKECEGWYPIALTGVHEFVNVECKRADGSPLTFGDRLVTSGKNAGYLRPLGRTESGGDAILGKAMTRCKPNLRFDQIHVRIAH